MLPPERRVPEVRGLIDHRTYFVLNAPRPVGKAMARGSIASAVTAEGHYATALELIDRMVWRDGQRDPLPEGLRQLDDPTAALGLDMGRPVMFDPRSAAGLRVVAN